MRGGAEQSVHRDNESSESSVKENENNTDIRGPGVRFAVIEEPNHYVRRFRVNGVRIVMRVLETMPENFDPILGNVWHY